MAAPTSRDLEREAEIDSFAVLDRPPLPALQRLADLAASLSGAVAEINVITATQQVHLAASNRNVERLPKEASFCNTIIGFDHPTYHSTDLLADVYFGDHPQVTGELGMVRFYAAVQLQPDGSGAPIGALCLFADKERTWSDEEMETLAMLGQVATEVLETHRRNVDLQGLLGRIQKSGRELVRSNESLVGFAGQVSHDLQGPLASVKMALEMFADLEGDVDSTREFLLDRAITGTERMRRTIIDLMDFATIGGGQLPVVVDLDETLDTVLADLSADVGAARVEATPLPRVLANEAEVRSVLQNFISNALKFGGQPDGASAHVLISGVRTGGMVRICVADNGPGVAPEDRDRIFQMMVRGQTDVEGRGIGLATCARIIASRGGAIGLDEAETGGALFWFELPAA